MGLLASCSGRQTKIGELEIIRLATAFENQTELKVSDCFSHPNCFRPDYNDDIAPIVCEVVSWFEEHPEARDLPDDVEQLRKVGEEDNPVVVIMK